MNKPIFFKPLYQERVWGGRKLASSLGRELPAEAPIGESWEVVDRPEAMSVVEGGAFHGMTLRALLEAEAEAVMGPGYDARRPFPILIKWLDCSDRLSLQVHPPASVAARLGGEPKTENWYIAECHENAALIVGLKEGVTRERFEEGLRSGELESHVHRFPVAQGESILVESGRLHAIDAGNLILEIQQNSDTTYRVYDWGRVGLDGKPRDLHVSASLQCIDWEDFEPRTLKPSGAETLLADCEAFRLAKRVLDPGASPVVLHAGDARLLSVVEGEVMVNGEPMARGITALLPASAAFEVAARTAAAFLITDRFV